MNCSSWILLSTTLMLMVGARPFGNPPHSFLNETLPKDTQSWEFIRIQTLAVNEQRAPQATLSAVQMQVVGVEKYLSKTLAVHRYLNKLHFAEPFMCGANLVSPKNYSADRVVYIDYESADDLTDGSAHVCVYDPVDHSPLISIVTLHLPRINDRLDHLFRILQNLYFKALGFDSFTYRFAKRADGQQYNETDFVYDDYDEFGKPVRRLRSPKVLAIASHVFQSDYQTGVPLSNSTSDIEFSARAMFGDVMSDSPAEFKYQVSVISLAFFEDLGWYTVDYSSASPIVFGRGQDGFLEESCQTGGFPEFCNLTSQQHCDAYHFRKSLCSPTNFTEGCPIFVDLSGDGDCRNLQRVDESQGEESCEECRCFERTVFGAQKAFCHRVSCSASSAAVYVNGDYVSCPASGGIAVLPKTGESIVCPPYDLLCEDCPNGCSGQGLCTEGECRCGSGRYGFDCSLSYPELCTSGSWNCGGCVNNAFLQSGICTCSSGYYQNRRLNKCLPCSSECLTCEERPDKCLTCGFGNILQRNKCSCPQGYFVRPAGQCTACDKTCESCSLAFNNCNSCKSGLLLTEMRKCICPKGSYFLEYEATCKACPSLCLTCTSQSQCTSCIPSLALINGSCACLNGQAPNSTGICVDCHPSCLTCLSSPSKCLKCRYPAQIVNSSHGICTFPKTNETLSSNPTSPSFLTDDYRHQMECVGDITGCFPIVKRGYYLTGQTAIRIWGHKKGVGLQISPDFAFGAFIRLHPSSNEPVIFSKVANNSTALLSFGLSHNMTLVLNITLGRYDEAHLGEREFISIDSEVRVAVDRWIVPSFQIQSVAASQSTQAATVLKLFLGGLLLKQLLIQEMAFEDVPLETEQSCLFGGLWTAEGVKKTVVGYWGDLKIAAAELPQAWNSCGCQVCGWSACLSNCSFTEQEFSSIYCIPY